MECLVSVKVCLVILRLFCFFAFFEDSWPGCPGVFGGFETEILLIQ